MIGNIINVDMDRFSEKNDCGKNHYSKMSMQYYTISECRREWRPYGRRDRSLLFRLLDRDATNNNYYIQ